MLWKTNVVLIDVAEARTVPKYYSFIIPRPKSDDLKNNLGEIASNLVLSLTQYFGLPFIPFTSARPAVVKTNGGNREEKPGVLPIRPRWGGAFLRGIVHNGYKH